MSEFLGANPADLRDFAKTLNTSAEQLSATEQQLRQVVSPLRSWKGSDASRFSSRFLSMQSPTLRRTAASLAELATELRKQAEQQEKASAITAHGVGSLPRDGSLKPMDAADATELQQKLDAMTPAEREIYLKSAEFKDWAAKHPDDAKSVLDKMADAGDIKFSGGGYSAFLEDYWLLKSMQEAGIDPDKWDPSKGYAYNRETIAAVYQYYGELYLQDPRMQWAGFAHMVGPGLDAGFADVRMMRDVARTLLQASAAAELVLPGGVLNSMQLQALAALTDKDIAYFETSLLEMQKEIFTSIGYQHQAYADGGMDEINRLIKAGVIDDKKLQTAWQQFDSGDPEKMALGTMNMADVEQNMVIADNYDRMRAHPLTGEGFTIAMSVVGTPSIPGAQSYSEANPLIVHVSPEKVPVPLGPFGPVVNVPNPLHDRLIVETPFPDGNIADDAQRWEFIKEDTYPAYMELANNPDQLREIVERQVTDKGYQEAVESNRLINRWPSVADQILFGDGNPFDGE